MARCGGRWYTAARHCCIGLFDIKFNDGVTAVTVDTVSAGIVCSQPDVGCSSHAPSGPIGRDALAPALGEYAWTAVAKARQQLPLAPPCCGSAASSAAATVTDRGLDGVSFARKHRRQ